MWKQIGEDVKIFVGWLVGFHLFLGSERYWKACLKYLVMSFEAADHVVCFLPLFRSESRLDAASNRLQTLEIS